ncbi:ATP-binding cassette domain-containing protein [Maribacter sp. 2308TA10-17]|uniref:ATP-binding cassette domain-containing protein n=1 Tax=Maribacter sp. 2308TA10-17 TaxID=3386276 RepID=UPI0039BD0DC6
MQHWAVFITNDSNKSRFVHNLLAAIVSELPLPKNYKGALFSKLALERFMDEENRHGTKIITQGTQQSLRSMSSGEQKKALLNHLFEKNNDYIILDNPFDNLDLESQKKLFNDLKDKADQIVFIQIISRKVDLLPFITNFASLSKEKLSILQNLDEAFSAEKNSHFHGRIPPPLEPIEFPYNLLIKLKDITVRFGDKTVLKNINWEINKGEFWQLIGKNGSGKTTILSMITGENPKGYGQELFLFGRKKGSGESIWDIKQKIGYFTPAMTDKFAGYHSIENMLISGFNDSIGLYMKPTEAQLRLAKEWLMLINLWEIKDSLFHDLSMGQKRLVMTIRAMIKHPLLLILDEPTAGLDDASSKLLVSLVNKIAKESNTATLFVSHRKEPGLEPDLVYELQSHEEGSTGKVVTQKLPRF